MKKILYIIPILLISIFLVNNVYAANYVDTIDDLYNLAETDRNTLGSNNWSDMWSGVNFDYTKLINSSTFQNKLKSYSYYTIFANYTGSKNIYVLFSNEEPTLTLYKDSSYYYKCKFDSITNYTYTYFSASSVTEYDVSKISSSTWYSNSSACEVSLLKLYSNSVNAYRYTLIDDFKNNICTNYDLKYTSTGVTVKEPIIEVICEYSDDYSSCDITFLHPQDTVVYYEFYSVLKEQYTEEEFKEIYKEGNPIKYYRKYINTITSDKNDSLRLVLYDLKGNELVRDSFDINKVIHKSDFSCNFVHDNGEINFMPFLLENTFKYYDIYIDYSADHNVGLMKEEDNTIISRYDQDDHSAFLESGTFYKFKKITVYNTNVKITFEIRSKDTGETIFTRGFDVLIPTIGSSSVISSSTNNTNDSFIDYGGESNSFGNDYQNQISNDINTDFNLDNSLNSAKNFFTSTIGFFNLVITFLSMFPAWLYVPIHIFLTMVVLISIIHLIRG